MTTDEWAALLTITSFNVALFVKTLSIRRQVVAGQQKKCTYDEWSDAS